MFRYAHRLARPYVKALQSGYRDVRRSFRDRSPPWIGRYADPMFDHFDLYMVDHGAIRLIYANRHAVAPEVWRSSQPSPHEIAAFARRGIRTIVNLRGSRDCGSYRLERAACQRHGIRLVDFPARSRAAPSRAFFHDVKALFETIEYPVLMHCKSGADRVGLMSVLYLLLMENRSAKHALRHLGLRYGHIRQADTGILDAVIETYAARCRQEPIAFLDWVDTEYDPHHVKAKFAARKWGNVLVDGVLRRE